MTRRRPESKKKRAKPATKPRRSAAATPPPSAAESPEEMRAAVIRRNVELLRIQQANGRALNGQQMRQLADYTRELAAAAGPPPVAEQAGETPPDIFCQTIEDIIKALGISRRNLERWRDAGAGLTGEAPYSLRAYCQALHEAGKLRYAKPRKDVAPLVAWALGVHGSADPDAPEHGDPISWKDEGERQDALRAMEARKLLEIQRRQAIGELVEEKVVAADLATLRDHVAAQLNSVMQVTAQCPTLTVEQRTQLADLLNAWIAEVRRSLAKKARDMARSIRA